MHQFYAFILGYYWLPCILCGRYRGGHEPSGTLFRYEDTPGTGHNVCINCTDKAEELSKGVWEKWYKDNPPTVHM